MLGKNILQFFYIENVIFRVCRPRHPEISPDGPRRLQMAPAGSWAPVGPTRWPQTAPDGSRWPRLAAGPRSAPPGGPRPQTAPDGPRRPQTAPNGPRPPHISPDRPSRQPQTAPDGPRWPQLAVPQTAHCKILEKMFVSCVVHAPPRLVGPNHAAGHIFRSTPLISIIKDSPRDAELPERLAFWHP